MSGYERSPRAVHGVNPKRALGVLQIAGRDRVAAGEGRADVEATPGDPLVTRRDLDGETSGIVPAQTDGRDPCPDLARALTARELQVAALVTAGHPNKHIARELHISEWTVVAYLRRIFLKLAVKNRTALAARCAVLIKRGSE